MQIFINCNKNNFIFAKKEMRRCTLTIIDVRKSKNNVSEVRIVRDNCIFFNFIDRFKDAFM